MATRRSMPILSSEEVALNRQPLLPCTNRSCKLAELRFFHVLHMIHCRVRLLGRSRCSRGLRSRSVRKGRTCSKSFIRYPPSVTITPTTFAVQYARVSPPRTVYAIIDATKHSSKEEVAPHRHTVHHPSSSHRKQFHCPRRLQKRQLSVPR